MLLRNRKNPRKNRKNPEKKRSDRLYSCSFDIFKSFTPFIFRYPLKNIKISTFTKINQYLISLNLFKNQALISIRSVFRVQSTIFWSTRCSWRILLLDQSMRNLNWPDLYLYVSWFYGCSGNIRRKGSDVLKMIPNFTIDVDERGPYDHAVDAESNIPR